MQKGIPKIADFGLTRAIKPNGVTVNKATYQYLSP